MTKKLTENEKKYLENIVKNIKEYMDKYSYTQTALIFQISAKSNYDFCQPTFSEIMNLKKFPTAMQLIALSDTLDMSIDDLLGRKKQEKPKDLSVYDACSMIAKLFTSDLGCEITEIPIQDEDSYFIHYPVITFPDYDFPCNQTPLQKRKAAAINDFLKKCIELRKMSDKISEELYTKILNEWLLEIKELSFVENE